MRLSAFRGISDLLRTIPCIDGSPSVDITAYMDQISLEALSILRVDGRASFSEIARQLGTNRNLVATRVNALLESGEYSVVAALHPKLLGLRALCNLGVRVFGPVEPVLSQVTEFDQVVFASRTAGSCQFVAELHCKDETELNELIGKIRSAPGVIELRINNYQRIVRSTYLAEEDSDSALQVDSIDMKIMDCLQSDGRMSVADIAKEVGLSVSGARTRVTKLLDSGAMKIGLVRQRSSDQGHLVVGMGFCVQGDPEELIRFFNEQPGVEFVSRTFGTFDVITTMLVESLGKLNELNAQIDALNLVTTREEWLHVQIKFERYQRGVNANT